MKRNVFGRYKSSLPCARDSKDTQLYNKNIGESAQLSLIKKKISGSFFIHKQEALLQVL